MWKIKIIFWEPGQGLGNASGSPAVNAWVGPGGVWRRQEIWIDLVIFDILICRQCSRIRILRCFQIAKKHDFYGVFEMTYQKVVKSHKKYQVCWMSIEILASKLPDVMGTYRLLSHTVFSCIVSCVCTSVQDVWCWWVVQGCTVLVLCDLAACKMSDLFMLPTKRYSVNYIWWIPRKCLDGYVWWLYRLLFCLKRTEAPLTKDPLLETWQIQA